MSQTIVAIDPGAVLAAAWTTNGEVDPRNARVCDMRVVDRKEMRPKFFWDWLREFVPKPDRVIWEAPVPPSPTVKWEAGRPKAKLNRGYEYLKDNARLEGVMQLYSGYPWAWDEGEFVHVAPNTWKAGITGKAFDRKGIAEAFENPTQSQRTAWEKNRVLVALKDRWPMHAERIGGFDHNAVDALAILGWFLSFGEQHVREQRAKAMRRAKGRR